MKVEATNNTDNTTQQDPASIEVQLAMPVVSTFFIRQQVKHVMLYIVMKAGAVQHNSTIDDKSKKAKKTGRTRD
jgi:hypothetical protein